MATEFAVLAGGCFWCLDAAFRRVKGVVSVQSGYTGGRVINPSYEDICSGASGHAEAVRVEFDTGIIGFGDILDLFFALHDPTTLNRQGADTGTQYRSAIFIQNPEQRAIAVAKISALDSGDSWRDPIVTTLEEAEVYYPAEDYHQKYVENNAGNRYCQLVVEPKLSKFFASHQDRITP